MNNDILKSFLSYISVKEYSEHTIRHYKKNIEEFALFSGKNYLEITIDDVIRYLASLKESGLKPNTIKAKTIALKSFYKYVQKQGMMRAGTQAGGGGASNIPYSIDIPNIKTEKRMIKVLSVNEVKRILNEIKFEKIQDYRDRALIELLYVTGMRVKELINLKTKDFQYYKVKEDSHIKHIRIYIRGKGKKNRVIFINRNTGNALLEYLIRRGEDNNDYLFISHNGKSKGNKLSEWGVRKIILKRVRQARIAKKVTPHIFRHSIATHLLKSGINIFILQNFLGHSSLESTRQYLELLDKDLRRVGEDVINKLLY